MKNNTLILYVSRRGYKIAQPLDSVGMNYMMIVCDGGLNARLRSFILYLRALSGASSPLVITDTARYIGILVWAGARFFKAPVIYRARGDEVTECRQKGLRLLEKFYRRQFLPYCSHIIPVSDYLRKTMLGQGLANPEKYTIVPTPQSIKVNEIIGYEERNPTILIVSAFGIRDKTMGLIDAINPLDCLLSRHPDYSVQLVGGGKYIKEVRQAVDSMINKKQVHVFGQVEDLQPHYTKSRLLLYVSGLDMFPSVINEARAYGLPVITIPVQGMKEQIMHDIDGYFIDDIENDLPEIIRNLEDSDNWNRLSRNGLETLRNYYTPEIIGKQFVDIIKHTANYEEQ